MNFTRNQQQTPPPKCISKSADSQVTCYVIICLFLDPPTQPCIFSIIIWLEYTSLLGLYSAKNYSALTTHDTSCGHSKYPPFVHRMCIFTSFTPQGNCCISVITASKWRLQRLCFHRCLSVNRGGVCPTACWDAHPHWDQRQTPQDQRQTPPRTRGRHTYRANTPAVHAGVQYTSHWNAFLLAFKSNISVNVCCLSRNKLSSSHKLLFY